LDSIRLNGAPQQHSRFEDVLLPNIFRKRTRAHSGSKGGLPMISRTISFGLVDRCRCIE
jgi:hypothetical protein